VRPGQVAHGLHVVAVPDGEEAARGDLEGTERRVALGHPRVEGTAPHVLHLLGMKSMGIQPFAISA